MFIKVPMKIFDYRLSGNEMKVYLYLARIQNDSEIAMAKRETIRMRCGLRSNTTVGSILHVLEQKGLISKFHRYAANGYYISSMYLLSSTGSNLVAEGTLHHIIQLLFQPLQVFFFTGAGFQLLDGIKVPKCPGCTPPPHGSLFPESPGRSA